MVHLKCILLHGICTSSEFGHILQTQQGFDYEGHIQQYAIHLSISFLWITCMGCPEDHENCMVIGSPRSFVSDTYISAEANNFSHKRIVKS